MDDAMLSRRQFSLGLGCAVAGSALLAACGEESEAGNNSAAPEGNESESNATAVAPQAVAGFTEQMQAIERESGGRLGVALIDTGNGRRFAWRGDERFPLCSTFKLLLAGATLARVDNGAEGLDRRIPVTAKDIIAHSTVTGEAVGGTLSIDELCAATLTTSDNAAANLLLARLGGPEKLTGWLRDIGDTVTRLDRPEPFLNESKDGDPRDTTSPVAIAEDLERLVVGATTLSAGSRTRLARWLEANQTGDNRIRAGAPEGWRIGDKTGTGERGATNDVAILWPPSGKPLLLSTYLVGSSAAQAAREKVLASAARAALRFVA